METVKPHQCEKCGQSFSDSGMLVSHPCSKRPPAPSSKGQLGNYKCSQCSEVFSKPSALRHHFRIIHSGHNPKGPFPCTERGCRFSCTGHQEYQAHLTSTHGLCLIPCTFRACKASFLTQAEIERHLQGHMPFGCFQCQFVTENEKDLSNHLLEHNHLSACTQGNEAASTTVCTNGLHQPQMSSRPKRNLKTKSAFASSLAEDGNKEQPEREGNTINKVKMTAEREILSAADTAPLPSKEYLAEGAEHIYRTHTCPMCRRCFKMRSHLQEHLHLHFPDPSLQCPTCKRYFTSKSKLRIHRLREAGEKVHRCHLCEYSAVERNAIRRHLVSVHADEAEQDVNSHSYPCPTCGQNFHQSRSLKAHMKMHNIQPGSKSVACFQDGCSFQSPLRKELLRHATEVHGVKAVECRHHACGAIFQKEMEMEAHYQTHLAYHCSQCDFSCSNKTVFLRHRRHGHPGNDKLCCDFCSFITFNPVEFEQHIGHLHANEKIHRCPQCSYVTSHKRGLKRHMLVHSGEKPHKCSMCEFRCRDESYLSKHMLTHSDDKNFMCAECGYVTKWKHYLNVHMRKHAGDLRYQCDQCPYRCHRMDQLNSHKLRHQAKSLMCEICAYACKRKNELRNHMLAKHSGEQKQPSVYKCKYCTYTTCYRQALQNHENCKHTKLKEFRCALCFYFSFSNISLFLHKRKAHGYVPGDKAWLENYAAKEKERNSTGYLESFYSKPSAAHEQADQSTEGPPPSQRDRSKFPAVADHSASKEAVVGSQTVGAVNVLDVISQEAVNAGISGSHPSVNSPEEYCTLVLTTLSTTDYHTHSLQNIEESCTNQTPRAAMSNRSQEKPEFSTSISSSEEDNVAVTHEECEPSDLDVSSQPLNISTSQPVEPEMESDDETITCTLPAEQNLPLESEVSLKAMKKYDKAKAEAMVLEGQVQMLVVQTKDVYRCDKCSYVTCKETALKYHCQALCHGRIKGHKCQACGAQFKQRRSLDGHLSKKCPALPQKTRTFVGISNTCFATERSSNRGTAGSKELAERMNSGQTELLSSQSKISTDSFHQQEEEVHAYLSDCRGFDEKVHTSSDSGHQQSETQKNSHLKVKLVKKRLASSKKIRSASLQTRYRRTEDQILSEVDDSEAVKGMDQHMINTESMSKKPPLFSCPSCAFKCNQKRALDSHDKRGCMKPDEVQCTICSFVAKSKMTLAHHIFYVHNKKKFGVAKPKRLHCQHCTFTCKQQRCMAHHVALKHKGLRPHRCQYCPFSTTRRYRMEEHESLHTGIGRHKCDMCDKTFGAVTKLRQHKMRIHDKHPTHFCSLCDFKGYTLDDIRRHNLRCHTGELKHACTHCDSRFSSEVALRNHCKRTHQLQVCFSCKQCNYTCSTEVALKSHQQSKHTQVKCTTCQESFQTKESLEVHQRTHLAHQCQLCPFAAKTRRLLAQHLLNEHEEGALEDKPLRCSSCKFACQHQLVLEQHLRSHGGKRLYKCTDCEYSTPNKQKITWHIRIHTGEKPYSCEQCSYTCTDPSRLKLHMRVHQEEKKYLCPDCGYKCKWATQLKYHMTKHTGEKPYACDECEYRTNRADALRAHRDTQHCDMRPYICETCGKAFKTSFILKTHQRQHSEDRPYTCGVCHKAFRWPAGLRHHYLSHTKQQPFCCRHCSYRAKQKFQVVKHLQRHHPEMSVEQGVVRDSEAVSLTLKEALQGSLDERAAEVEEGNVNEVEEVAEEVVQRRR
uniref:C2H2-type domain-containing protein n=2 Tax=Monopterus albus TaxID=43700 RepID=A0A3Q3JN43_MONAL|nr:zinc finger protein 142 isoform X2 [Monopterus albus]XP_020477264.1 zinc finger protein 142 isoform X2 [Monopterus albus]XP_020477265.1 zinc finger protein 142 isoform X2 [Monopterus albus]XP_020477266.1 zinc finger protein 142 isoform X2 [Monopterus albus]